MPAKSPPSRSARPASGSTLVLLVRHGRTPTTGTKLPGRAAGLHLSDAGRAEAGAAAAQIQAVGPVSAVYSSPLERTRETAAIIAKAVGVRVRTNRGLIECDFGDWTGRDLKALQRLRDWATVQQSPSTWRFPGGESFTEMQLRITEALYDLHRRHPGETIVAVSHADPIKGAIAAAVGTHIDLFQRIVVSPCSISAIRYGDRGPSVLTVNVTSDLSTLVNGTGPRTASRSSARSNKSNGSDHAARTQKAR